MFNHKMRGRKSFPAAHFYKYRFTIFTRLLVRFPSSNFCAQPEDAKTTLAAEKEATPN
jgi:hypothetical protein